LNQFVCEPIRAWSSFGSAEFCGLLIATLDARRHCNGNPRLSRQSSSHLSREEFIWGDGDWLILASQLRMRRPLGNTVLRT